MADVLNWLPNALDSQILTPQSGQADLVQGALQQAQMQAAQTAAKKAQLERMQQQQGMNTVNALANLDPNDPASTSKTMGALIQSGAFDAANAVGAGVLKRQAQAPQMQAAQAGLEGTSYGGAPGQPSGQSPQGQSPQGPSQAPQEDPNANLHSKLADDAEKLEAIPAGTARFAAAQPLIQQYVENHGIDPEHAQAFLDHLHNDPDGGTDYINKQVIAPLREAAAKQNPSSEHFLPGSGMSIEKAQHYTSPQGQMELAAMTKAGVDTSGIAAEAGRVNTTNAAGQDLPVLKTFQDPNTGTVYKAGEKFHAATAAQGFALQGAHPGVFGTPSQAELETTTIPVVTGSDKNGAPIITNKVVSKQQMLDATQSITPNTGQLNPRAFFSNFVLPHEGGLNPRDTNGTPSNFGINQAANKDIDVSKLTPETAAGVFEDRYFQSSKNLPPALAAVNADTEFMAGPDEAKALLQQSGGDPMRYMQLREAFLTGLAQKNPQKYGKYVPAWDQRNKDLTQFAQSAAGGGAIPGSAPNALPNSQQTAQAAGAATGAAAAAAQPGINDAATSAQDNQNFRTWATQYTGSQGNDQFAAVQQKRQQDLDLIGQVDAAANKPWAQQQASVNTLMQHLGIASPASSPEVALRLLQQKFGNAPGSINQKDPVAVIKYFTAYDAANADYKAKQIKAVQEWAASHPNAQDWNASEFQQSFNKQNPAGIFSDPSVWRGVSGTDGKPYVYTQTSSSGKKRYVVGGKPYGGQ